MRRADRLLDPLQAERARCDSAGRAGYDAHEDPNPGLTISAVRLDGLAPPMEIENATNARGNGWDAMLVGMEFPTEGCWEILGTYSGAQNPIVAVFVTDE